MPHEPNRISDAPDAAQRSRSLRAVLVVTALLLAPAMLVGGYLLIRALPTNGHAQECPDDPPAKEKQQITSAQTGKPDLFAGWGVPDLAIVVSGQMHGYMFPCGCSEPQNGGLVRRMTFIEELKAAKWPVVGVDLGELPALTGIRRQRELKLQATMKSLELMGYRAVGLGKHEMSMPLIDALAAHSLDHPLPRPLAGTLDLTEKKGDKYFEMNVRPYTIFGGENGTPKVGVVSLIGPDLEDSFKDDKDLKFRNNRAVVLPKVFDAFAKEKVEIAMLLHHEYPAKDVDNPKRDLRYPNDLPQIAKARYKMAEACARNWEAERVKAAKNGKPAIPPLSLMMILTEEPEPPSVMHPVQKTPTNIIEIGHKGKYVGVVGVFKKGPQLTFKYDIVLMDQAFEPRNEQKNKVLDVFEEYARQVHKEDLLGKFIRSDHPIQRDAFVLAKYGGSEFAGSEKCQECHNKEHKIWANTRHAQLAFKSLVQKKNPSLRQFDPECVVCHTVGFQNPGGYNDLPRAELEAAKPGGKVAVDAALAKHNARLMNVGCESCHGPASAHANPKNCNDPKLHELINPFRPSDKEANAQGEAAKKLFDARMHWISEFCTKCHDQENDVNWLNMRFLEDKWVGGGIVHTSKGNVGYQWLPKLPPKSPATDTGK